jgi:hypothetical protein
MKPATAEAVAAAADAGSLASATATEPELTLNLNPQECACPEQGGGTLQPATAGATVPTALERGFSSLAANEYVEAVQFFQRYKRQQKSPTANWESGVGVAYVSMLSNSPLYDADAARKSYRRLKKQLTPVMLPHQQSVLMSQALDSFVVMQRHISDLEDTTATLKKDLKKREEAIKRLRELTLGQKESGR